MAEFDISDTSLQGLKDKVVVITGGSSGIGLATTKLLLSLGASVVVGDLNPTPLSNPSLSFQRTDVTSWSDLSSLFKHAKQLHGRIDHVFANAGISLRTTYLDETLDENGDLQEPNHSVLDVNLKGVINTTALAIHYMRKQNTGGSVVITASATSFQRFRGADYAVAKHGVLGLMRSLIPNIQQVELPIRINAIAPSWTETGIVPRNLLEAAGAAVQSADVPAKSAVLLMADGNRQGELIYSRDGKFKEVENSLLLRVAKAEIVGEGNLSEDEAIQKTKEIASR
ncbi:hypothetical protein VTO42DRAFT_7189 [Malbranchea cinnamomea]